MGFRIICCGYEKTHGHKNNNQRNKAEAVFQSTFDPLPGACINIPFLVPKTPDD